MQRNMYPHMDAIYGADARQLWIERSGPMYAEVEINVLEVFPDCDLAMIEYEDESRDVLGPPDMSYASWQMLRQAKSGEALALKLRIDDAYSARKTA